MPWRIYNVPEKVKLKTLLSSLCCTSAQCPSTLLNSGDWEVWDKGDSSGSMGEGFLTGDYQCLSLSIYPVQKENTDIMIPLVTALITFLRTLPYQLHEFSKAPPLRTISWRSIYQHFNWDTIYTQKQAQKVNLYSFLWVQLSWNSVRIWLSNKVIM